MEYRDSVSSDHVGRYQRKDGGLPVYAPSGGSDQQRYEGKTNLLEDIATAEAPEGATSGRRHAPLRRAGRAAAYAGALASLLFGADARGQCQYEVTVIQAPDVCGILGPVHTFGTGLNENGAVVGSWKCPVWEDNEAFVWTPASGLTTLARPTGVRSASATDISDDGVVVGTYLVANVGYRGFVYEDGKFTELSPLPGAAWSGASAINNAGQVVGFRSIGEGVNPQNAFVWSAKDGFTDLGVMSGGISDATDNNDLGQVTGSTGHFGFGEAFLWDSGVVLLLGPVPNGTASHASAVSNRGTVAGVGFLETDDPGGLTGQPALWRDGEWLLLGWLPGCDSGGARDINDATQVIGACSGPGNATRPFLWQYGMMSDLNDLVVPQPGVQIERAKAINNSGQIVCDGKDAAGRRAAILLTPIDRPLGDLDFDCRVRVPDLLTLLANWGSCPPPGDCRADLNGDGKVDEFDLVHLLVNWG